MPDREEIGGDGRRRARWLIRQLRIQHVPEIDVEAIAADRGLLVRTGGIVGAKGRLASNGRTGIIRVAERITDEAERRFVVAHEIGHHELHARRGGVALCLDVDGDLVNYADSTQETEANCFAAELLMPRSMFDARCDVKQPSLEVVRRLAREFRATLTATAIRFVDGCPEACAIVWSEHGHIRWCASGPGFRAWIPTKKPVSALSHAYDAFEGKPPPLEPEPVPSDAWLEQGPEEVMEHTIYSKRYDGTLTLLWIPDRS